MKRIIPFVLLAFVAVGCERDGPTVPVDGPEFAKGKPNCDVDPSHPSCKDDGGGDGGGGKAVYSFVWPETPEAAQELGGDCWRPHWEEGYEDNPEEHPENPYGRTWRCPVGGDPTLAFRVVDSDGNLVAGTVTFLRCEDEGGVPQTWHYCGVRHKDRRSYSANQYGDPVPVVDGIVGVTLLGEDRVVLHEFPIQGPGDQYGWGGMRWYYDAGDGKKPELESNWYNFMPPYGYQD